MLEWLLKGHELLEYLAALITLGAFAGQVWKARKAVGDSLRRASNWLASLVSPEYREAYQLRKLRTMRTKLRYLRRFSHEDEMDRLSKIYSRLSTALFFVVMDALFLVCFILIVLLWGLTILEKEILHEQVKPQSAGGGHYGLAVSAVLLAFATFWPITEIGRQALYLSRRYRALTIRTLRRKLTALYSQRAKDQPLITESDEGAVMSAFGQQRGWAEPADLVADYPASAE